jgi:hypothetical protein
VYLGLVMGSSVMTYLTLSRSSKGESSASRSLMGAMVVVQLVLRLDQIHVTPVLHGEDGS